MYVCMTKPYAYDMACLRSSASVPELDPGWSIPQIPISKGRIRPGPGEFLDPVFLPPWNLNLLTGDYGQSPISLLTYPC